MEPKYLRPNPTRPIPLKEDFWKSFLRGSEEVAGRHRPSFRGSEELAGSSTYESSQINNIRARNVEAEVGEVLRRNMEAIDEAVLKQVAPTATNVEGNQYENLVSLSFDQEVLLQKEEEKRRRKREEIVRKALR